MGIAATIASLVLIACTGRNSDNLSGRFRGELAGTQLHTDGRCIAFDTDDNFTFLSDGPGDEDQNGDGLVVRGDLYKVSGRQKFSLAITVGHGRYSVANIADWEKTRNGMRGAGELSEDSATATTAVTFTVTCS